MPDYDAGFKIVARLAGKELAALRVKPGARWRQWPGILPLYPLCAHHRPGRDAVIVPAKAIDEAVPDSVLRADLLTTLAIFGKLAYPGLDVLHLIGSEKMRESKFFEEVAELGAIEARRDDIARIAAERFGAGVRPALEERLVRIEQTASLIELLSAALRCNSISELYQEVDARIAAAEASRKRRRTRSH